jgi:hypothetical protein
LYHSARLGAHQLLVVNGRILTRSSGGAKKILVMNLGI